MSVRQKKPQIAWKDDSPCLDWWESKRLTEIGGRLIYTDIDIHAGCRERRELVTEPARLVEIAGQMGRSDEDIAAALAILER